MIRTVNSTPRFFSGFVRRTRAVFATPASRRVAFTLWCSLAPWSCNASRATSDAGVSRVTEQGAESSSPAVDASREAGARQLGSRGERDAAPRCESGTVFCAGVCTNVRADAAHCGKCDASCAFGSVCALGRCVAECPGERVDCNAACVDVRTDPHHCGACGVRCPFGERCSGGVCGDECEEPYVECDGRCRDFDTDAEHCGACGSDCGLSGLSRCQDGSCVPVAEQCSNGRDDDGDGLFDCEDAECSARVRCLPPVGDDFSHPFVLLTGGAEEVLSCPSDFPDVVASGLFHGLVAPDADCDCSCTVEGVCRVALQLYGDPGCLGAAVGDLPASRTGTSEACTALETDGSVLAVGIGRATVATGVGEGRCLLSETVLDARFSERALGCAPQSSTAGCEPGGLCLPTQGERYCVAAAGDRTCPAGYPERRVMYTGYADDRRCEACQCTPECASTLSVFTDLHCSQIAESLAAAESCAMLPTDPTLSGPGTETRSVSVPAPYCDASAAAVGSATAAGGVSICCEAGEN